MSRNWARLALAATGIVGTVVFLVGALTSNLPMYGDSLTEWGPWAATNQSDARHEVATLFLAYLLYMVFGVYVATAVRSSDPWTTFAARAATVAVGVKFTIEMMQIAILNVPTAAGSQDYGRSIGQLGTELSVISLVPFAVFLLAVGASGLISRAVPVWLAWFALAVGALHAFAMLLGLTGPPPLGPALMAFGFVWFLSIPAWPLVTGVTLFIRALGRTKPASAQVPQTMAGGQPA